MPIHMISQGDEALSHIERIQVLKLHQFIAANEDEKLEPTLRIIEQQLLEEGKQLSDKEPRLALEAPPKEAFENTADFIKALQQFNASRVKKKKRGFGRGPGEAKEANMKEISLLDELFAR